MSWAPSNLRKLLLWGLLVVTGLAALAQIVPFLVYPVPGSVPASLALSKQFPVGYSTADHLKADRLDSAVFWGGLAATLATLSTLATLYLAGMTDRIGTACAPRARVWLVRVAFLVAVFLILQAIDLPFRYCRFQHFKAVGLTHLSASAWFKLLLASLSVPLLVFILKHVFVICTLPLCARAWWVVTAFGLFLIRDVTPEVISRTYPLDPIEHLQPLTEGPHAQAMKALLNKVGLNLPLMVVDQSQRSLSANICLTGRTRRQYVLITDTFIQQYTPQEVTSALAHELGHLQRGTLSVLINKSSALVELLLTFGLAFALSGRCALPVSAAPRVVVLTLFCAVFVSSALSPLSLALSRREERFADRYALQLTQAPDVLSGLLLKVAQHELQPLDLPPWRYYLSASHPTPLQRIALASERSSAGR